MRAKKIFEFTRGMGVRKSLEIGREEVQRRAFKDSAEKHNYSEIIDKLYSEIIPIFQKTYHFNYPEEIKMEKKQHDRDIHIIIKGKTHDLSLNFKGKHMGRVILKNPWPDQDFFYYMGNYITDTPEKIVQYIIDWFNAFHRRIRY